MEKASNGGHGGTRHRGRQPGHDGGTRGNGERERTDTDSRSGGERDQAGAHGDRGGARITPRQPGGPPGRAGGALSVGPAKEGQGHARRPGQGSTSSGRGPCGKALPGAGHVAQRARGARASRWHPRTSGPGGTPRANGGNAWWAGALRAPKLLAGCRQLGGARSGLAERPAESREAVASGPWRQLRDRRAPVRPCARPCGVVSSCGSRWRLAAPGTVGAERGRPVGAVAPDDPNDANDARDDVEGEEQPNGTDDEHGPTGCVAAVVGSRRFGPPRASRRRAADPDDVPAAPAARGRRGLGLEFEPAARAGDHHADSIPLGHRRSEPPVSSGSVARWGVVEGAEGRSTNREEALARLSEQAEAVLSLLPEDGSGIGNGRLRDLSGLDEPTYDLVVLALVALGKARRGRGRGGSLARSDGAGDGSASARPVSTRRSDAERKSRRRHDAEPELPLGDEDVVVEAPEVDAGVLSGPGGLFEKIRAHVPTDQGRGLVFQRLMKAFLSEDPLFVDRFKRVWQWHEWPSRPPGEPDTGIDLVAQERDGGVCAIQCKFYAPNTTISREDINSFLGASGRRPFTARLFVSTTERWGRNAEKVLADQLVPVQRIGIAELSASPFDWSRFDPTHPEQLHRHGPKALKLHQRAAIADVVDGFASSDRGKLIMACGTGKTFTALRLAEQIVPAGGVVCFCVPSIPRLPVA